VIYLQNNNKNRSINKNVTRASALLGTICTWLFPSLVFAADAEASQAVTTDTLKLIWIAICAILVLFMQAGFLLLEGGMVRSKNTINVVLKNFSDIGLGTIGFWIFGFGVMYGANSTGWFGTDGFFPTYSDSGSTLTLLYQMMFAATAATILSGAVAERFSFLPYISGAFVITSLVYPVFGSWAWNDNGWLAQLGFYDAAGATVVHSIGGWCALGALALIGPRSGRYSRKGAIHTIPGHNLPYVAIGGFILWFGWFGFNGGSVNDDFSNLGQILLNTHLGAIGGITGSILWLTVTRKGFYMTSIVNGALGGLVSVTAGIDVMAAHFALLTGLIGGVVVVTTTSLLNRLRIDDVVGAIPVHAFCGAWGTLAVGFFYQGDLFNLERIVAQVIGIVMAFIWGVTISYCLFWTLNRITHIRVPTKFEQRGLDISEHKEIGYSDFMTTHARADV